MNLVDTHAHLYWDSFKQDFDQMIQRCLDASVTTIINVGVDVEKSKTALKQVQKQLSEIANFSAYSTIGIHPHESNKYNASVSIHDDIEKLEQIYQVVPNKVVAVGECGLDYVEIDEQMNKFFPSEIKQRQRQLFQAQINLAKKLNLPLIVHCRDDRSQNPLNCEAWNEVLEMVGDHPTILHCYSGLEKTTKLVLEKTRVLVSFAATITYPKNEYLRQAVKTLPLEKIVLETDCPFLPPQSKRGQRNEPANILEVAQLVADLKGISLAEVARQTTNNVKEILRLRSG